VLPYLTPFSDYPLQKYCFSFKIPNDWQNLDNFAPQKGKIHQENDRFFHKKKGCSGEAF
jgi:hypothetical protein